MGKKRGIDDDDAQSRKKPARHHPYKPRSNSKSSSQKEDREEHDLPRRLSELRLRAVKFPVAKTVSQFVKKTGKDQYEFDIPFHKLPEFHRIEWGVKDSAKSILVRLEFLYHEMTEYVGFCVHLPPGDRESETEHKYCTTDAPWKEGVVCNTESNFLTDALSHKLHDLLGQGRRTAKKIYDKIVEVARSNPAAKCFICAKKIPCKVFRPLPCSAACREKFKKLPLATRLSPFLLDPTVIDFLLCCLASTTWEEPVAPSHSNYLVREHGPQIQSTVFHTTLPSTCPVAKELLNSVLDSFPDISCGTTKAELLEAPKFRHQREKLLDWLCTEFDGTLVTAPKTAHLSNIPGARQFILLNGNIERQTAFDKAMKRSGISGGGFAGFHGTPPDNLFNILREGLKGQRNVYYANDPVVSVSYLWKHHPRGALGKWKNSAIGDATALFGVEVAVSNLTFQVVEANSHQDTVMVRYVFLLPSSRYESYISNDRRRVMFHTACTVLPSMQDTYTQIKSGDLIKAMQKQAQDEEEEGA